MNIRKKIRDHLKDSNALKIPFFQTYLELRLAGEHEMDREIIQEDIDNEENDVKDIFDAYCLIDVSQGIAQYLGQVKPRNRQRNNDQVLESREVRAGDFPKIHVAFEDETSSQPTIDTLTRYRDTSFVVSVFLDEVVVEDGNDIDLYDATNELRLYMMENLEQCALEIDERMVKEVEREFEEITVLDLDSVNYEIDPDGTFNTGYVQLSYNMSYVMSYQPSKE